MLAGIAIASPPAARMLCATCSQAGALRLEITTFAPALARCFAMERPMPRVEPVTIATLPPSANASMVYSEKKNGQPRMRPASDHVLEAAPSAVLLRQFSSDSQDPVRKPC